MQKRYTLKIYSISGTYIKTINPSIVKNQIVFTSQINGGQGQCIIDLDLPFDNFDEGVSIKQANFVKIYEADDVNSTTPRLIYTGFISQYVPYFDRGEEGVKLVLLGLVSLLALAYYKSGSNYTFTVSTTDPAAQMRQIIDHFNSVYDGSWISYGDSVVDVGSNSTYEYKDLKWFDALKKMFDLGGGGRYWKIDESGELHFKDKPSAAVHRFTLGYDLDSGDIVKNGEKIINQYQLRYGTGYTSSADFDDQASIDNYGTREKVQNDERVSVAGTVTQKGNTVIEDSKNPKIEARLRVNSNYDIESIKPGDTCSIFNYHKQSFREQDLHLLTSTTDWYLANDAVNLRLSSAEGKLEFDVVVDNNVEDYAQIGNSTLTPVDISAYSDGYIEMQVYIPDATHITAVDTNIGSMGGVDGQYGVATTDYLGNAIKSGLNTFRYRISEMVPWGNGADLSAINYILMKLSYSGSQADMSGVKLLSFKAIYKYTPFPENMLITSVRYTPDYVDIELENNAPSFADTFSQAVNNTIE